MIIPNRRPLPFAQMLARVEQQAKAQRHQQLGEILEAALDNIVAGAHVQILQRRVAELEAQLAEAKMTKAERHEKLKAELQAARDQAQALAERITKLEAQLAPAAKRKRNGKASPALGAGASTATNGAAQHAG